MKEIINYIKQNLDTRAEFHKKNMSDVLPIYLCSNYTYYKGTFLDTDIWLVEVINEMTIDAMIKQREKLEESLSANIVFTFKNLSRYKRRQLLEKRLPFIYGDKQIYLPFIYLNIQEIEKQKYYVKKDKFTPQVQMICLYCMYQNKEMVTQKDATNQLDLPVMNVSRAFALLENLNILTVSKGGKTGKVKYYHIDDKKEIYQKAKQYLQSPVKGIKYIKKMPEKAVLSGISALADRSMINDNKIPTLAVTDKEWQQIEDLEITREEALDGGFAIHVFQYDFHKLLLNGKMDPLSMILSITDRDERVNMEIESVMGEFEWYED